MKKDLIHDHLDYLRLEYVQKEHRNLAQQAAREQWSHGDYLNRLMEGEVSQRQQRALELRLRKARFPFRRTLEQYQWTWPRKINQMAVRQLFTLKFMEDHNNVVFMGSVGLGKTHLAVAVGLEACQAGHSVLYVPAIQVINELLVAQKGHRLRKTMKKYAGVDLLILDEIGYLPIDKAGADLLYQVLAERYEKASTVLTTNRAYKEWVQIFNNDATMTSALLDRLLHHVETIVIEGRSYRSREHTETP
ncbi:MAG: IS21-like element helper ATPase IstB [Verrucomicrobiota bacterium]